MVLKQTRQDFQILFLSFSLSHIYLSIYLCMHFSRKENEKKEPYLLSIRK